MAPETQHDAGDFGTWLQAIRDALEHGDPMDVACGNCTACCRASYFIPVAPGEAAFQAIPDNLLFPAPRDNRRLIMGYDKRGRCPMLSSSGCEVYAARPMTCQQYDCRIFAATAIAPQSHQERHIAQRAKRWTFTYADERSRKDHSRLQASGRWLLSQRAALPVEISDVQLALLAIRGLNLGIEPRSGVHVYRDLWENPERSKRCDVNPPVH